MPGTLSFAFCVLCCTANLFAYSEKNDSTFVASREWQTVKKGQPIPSGLHIRHNFQTGLTEAKLLDEDAESNSDSSDDNEDEHTKSLTLHPDESLRLLEDDVGKTDTAKPEADKLKISLDDLKHRLKRLKLVSDDIQTELNDQKSDDETLERFKSYTNLKNEFKALEVNVTTDAEMLTTFFQRFESHRDSIAAESLTSPIVDEVLQLLNNMEYLLHQIDNAQTFADMGGMGKIISPCFNTTNDEIKSEALRLLGTAVQSNPKVQAKALEHDFVQKLLHILVLNNKVTVQSRCLFALSALVRQYPFAQKALVDHGGLEIFGQILEDGHLQTQSRILNLVSDLVVERIGLRDIEDESLRQQKAQEHTNADSVLLDELEDDMLRQRKIREYANTDFEQKLLAQNYCKHLSNLMIKSFSNEAFGDSNMEDYGFLSVIIDSMITLGSTCKSVFRAERYSIIAVIKEAARHYESVGDASSSDDDYSFGHLASQLTRLRETIFAEIKDEL